MVDGLVALSTFTEVLHS